MDKINQLKIRSPKACWYAGKTIAPQKATIEHIAMPVLSNRINRQYLRRRIEETELFLRLHPNNVNAKEMLANLRFALKRLK